MRNTHRCRRSPLCSRIKAVCSTPTAPVFDTDTKALRLCRDRHRELLVVVSGLTVVQIAISFAAACRTPFASVVIGHQSSVPAPCGSLLILTKSLTDVTIGRCGSLARIPAGSSQ